MKIVSKLFFIFYFLHLKSFICVFTNFGQNMSVVVFLKELKDDMIKYFCRYRLDGKCCCFFVHDAIVYKTLVKTYECTIF